MVMRQDYKLDKCCGHQNNTVTVGSVYVHAYTCVYMRIHAYTCVYMRIHTEAQVGHQLT